MTKATFTIVGTSTLAGVTKLRFANDMTRVKVLEKNEHTNIDLREVGEPQSKFSNVVWFMQQDISDIQRATAVEWMAKNEPAYAIEKGLIAAPEKKTRKAKTEAAPEVTEQPAQSDADAKREERNRKRREQRAAKRAEQAAA